MTHTDETWRPSASWDTLRARARLLGVARAFFASRDILEVDTPTVGRHGVTEPHIASIGVRLAARPGAPHFLQTSPEYALKRLLAAGGPDLYQLGKVFRDGELGPRHQPEFTLVEWYRRGISLDAMIDETCVFVAELIAAGERGVGGRRGPQPIIERHAYADLFQVVLSIDPLDAPLAALQAEARQRIESLTNALALQLGDDRSAWLDLLMSYVVIPNLPDDTLSVIHHYPAAQAALARLDPADPGRAERFEVFYGALELANGYRELTDADEQRRRFAADVQRREAAGAPAMAADPAFMAALEHGLPDCCGVAVGFDRVVMCALGLDSIDAAISFAL